MNSNSLLMLALGVVAGVVIGRSLKQCDVPDSPKTTTTKDVLAGLIGLGSKVTDLWSGETDKSPGVHWAGDRGF